MIPKRHTTKPTSLMKFILSPLICVAKYKVHISCNKDNSDFRLRLTFQRHTWLIQNCRDMIIFSPFNYQKFKIIVLRQTTLSLLMLVRLKSFRHDLLQRYKNLLIQINLSVIDMIWHNILQNYFTIALTLKIPAIDNVRPDVCITSKNSLDSSTNASTAPIISTPMLRASKLYS